MNPFEENFTVPDDLNPSTEITKKVKEFIRKFKVLEVENNVPLILIFDKRSEAFYSVCHLDSETLTTRSDLDAVLDPAESEEYKLNRNIYTDTYSYRLMEKDAIRGRSFEDIVVEYDDSYRPDLPLKVFGGQHRVMAIKESARQGISTVHGVRVYFNLTVEQKVNIAMASNTAIAVSNDLLDRMQEDLLGNDLRNWCQSVGILDNDQHFADRKNPEGTPTVRIARTLIVNYYMGKLTEDGMNLPIVCSSGKGVDRNYKKIRDGIHWTERNFIRCKEKLF